MGFGAGQLLVRQTKMPNGRRDIRALNLMLAYCKPRDERLVFQRDQSTVIKPAATSIKLQQPLTAAAVARLDPPPLFTSLTSLSL